MESKPNVLDQRGVATQVAPDLRGHAAGEWVEAERERRPREEPDGDATARLAEDRSEGRPVRSLRPQPGRRDLGMREEAVVAERDGVTGATIQQVGHHQDWEVSVVESLPEVRPLQAGVDAVGLAPFGDGGDEFGDGHR